MQPLLGFQICNAAVPIIRVSEHTLFIIHDLTFKVQECVKFPGASAIACTPPMHGSKKPY